MSGLRADESESLTPQAREVLEAARRVPVAPDQATIERMNRAVLLATGAVGAASAVSAAGAGAGKVGSTALSVKLVIASTITVLAVSGGLLAVKLSQPPPEPPPVSAPLLAPQQPPPAERADEEVVAPPTPLDDATPPPPKRSAPRVTPPQAAREPPAPPPPEPGGPDDTFKRELKLLEEARTQLQARDWGAVLGSIEKHDAQFPQGVLGAEAEVLRILSLCEVNRVSEALERTKHLQRTAGRSPALLRLAGSCVEP